MSTLGERVLAVWPHEIDWIYPGVVVGVNGLAVDIQFDDGGRATVNAEQIFPLVVRVGQKIQCRWKGGDGFYGGTLSEVIGSAVRIDYDDGDKEITSVSLLRIKRSEL